MKLKNALITVLNKKSDLSASEVYSEILSNGIKLDLKGKTPEATVAATLSHYSDNSTCAYHYKNRLFTITSRNPNRYSLIKKPKLDTDMIVLSMKSIESLSIDNEFIKIKMKTD